MSDNFAITDIYYSDAPGVTRAILFTNNPCHLTAYKTGKKPVRLVTWVPRRGVPFYCVPKWTFLRAKSGEQNEAGDTLVHTIDTPGWKAGQTYWLIITGTVTGNPSPSVGPVLQHINGGGYLTTVTRFPSDAGDKCQLIFATYPCPLHYRCVNEDPPDWAVTHVWSTRTGGAFPNYDQCDFYQIEPVPSPLKYALIANIRIDAFVRRFHVFGNWQEWSIQPGYTPLLKLAPPHFLSSTHVLTTPWGSWHLIVDFWDTNPWTGKYWDYQDLGDMQLGVDLQRPYDWGVRIYSDITQLKLSIRYWGL